MLLTTTRGQSGAGRTLGASTFLCSLVALTASVGCNSLDAPIPAPTGDQLVIPTDTRAPVRASKAPVPVSGGTLLVTRSGLTAVASDPDRDQLVVADLGSGTLRGKIALNAGDEPGRLVEDDSGRVHVALRRGGAIASVDLASMTVVDRRAVCAAPRGLAVSSTQMLDVACADGKLVTLPAAGGPVVRSLALDADLRDVIETPTGLTVTRFKSAEVLRLDTTGAITRRDRIPEMLGMRQVPDPSAPSSDPAFGAPLISVEQPFKSLVAWRAIPADNGATIVVHQRAVDAEVAITPPTMDGGAYGSAGPSGFSCNGISQNGMSVVAADGSVVTMGLATAPLPVDAAVVAGGWVAVVTAGPRDNETPRPFVVSADADNSNDLAVPSGFGPSGPDMTVLLFAVPTDNTNGAPAAGSVRPDNGCSLPAGALPITDPAVAVAAVPGRQAIVVQTVQPSTLVTYDFATQTSQTISFDDGATLDTGFQLFHRASPAGIACASCHPEGAEDGNVWTFESFGPRRTQALNAGLEGTAPFHWDGQLPTVASLMSDVFVGRMGGVHEADPRLSVFQSWLFGLKAPVPMRAADDAAAVRGNAVFDSSGCKACHSGRHFTNNRSLDVGTRSAVPLQVPSLIGVGYRAPFLHDGCAATLLDRFDPACGGGDNHGFTSSLSAADKGDLVAFLESL